MTPFERKRKALGLSQEELARRVGVNRVNITRWENGTCEPRAEFYPRLAEALGLTGEQVTHLFEPTTAAG